MCLAIDEVNLLLINCFVKHFFSYLNKMIEKRRDMTLNVLNANVLGGFAATLRGVVRSSKIGAF